MFAKKNFFLEKEVEYELAVKHLENLDYLRKCATILNEAFSLLTIFTQ